MLFGYVHLLSLLLEINLCIKALQSVTVCQCSLCITILESISFSFIASYREWHLHRHTNAGLSVSISAAPSLVFTDVTDTQNQSPGMCGPHESSLQEKLSL